MRLAAAPVGIVAPRIISMFTGPNQRSLCTKRRSPNSLVGESSAVKVPASEASSMTAAGASASGCLSSMLIVELLEGADLSKNYHVVTFMPSDNLDPRRRPSAPGRPPHRKGICDDPDDRTAHAQGEAHPAADSRRLDETVRTVGLEFDLIARYRRRGGTESRRRAAVFPGQGRPPDRRARTPGRGEPLPATRRTGKRACGGPHRQRPLPGPPPP